MSTLKKAGPPSRLRAGGMALFGVATVAALIGLVLAVNRAGQSTAAGPAGSPIPASVSARPSVIPFPPPAASNQAQAPVVSPSVVPSTGGAPPAGEKIVSRGEIRIYNNSTIRGLATRAARDLSAAGWTVVEVGNFARETIPATTVYYEGGDQQAEAEAVATQFRMRVEPRFPGMSSLPAGVIVIVTNDYAH